MRRSSTSHPGGRLVFGAGGSARFAASHRSADRAASVAETSLMARTDSRVHAPLSAATPKVLRAKITTLSIRTLITGVASVLAGDLRRDHQWSSQEEEECFAAHRRAS